MRARADLVCFSEMSKESLYTSSDRDRHNGFEILFQDHFHFVRNALKTP